MRGLPLKKRIATEWEGMILAALFLLLAVLTYLCLQMLQETAPGTILQNALQNMEQNVGCLELKIEEKGPGYRLDFAGVFKDNAIYGRFPAYGLEVYRELAGELFVKDLKDNLWKKAPDPGLASLEDFFIFPFDVLTAWSHLFRKASYLRADQGGAKVIRLPVSSPEIEKTALYHIYPQEYFSRLECLVYLKEDDLFINQIVFSLQDDLFVANYDLTFSFKAAGESERKIIPADLEQLLKTELGSRKADQQNPADEQLLKGQAL